MSRSECILCTFATALFACNAEENRAAALHYELLFGLRLRFDLASSSAGGVSRADSPEVFFFFGIGITFT